MLTCRLWQVRFSKSTILLILQLLPRLLPHKPMRLKAGLLIPTSLRAAKSWRWQTVGCTSSPLPLTVMRQRTPAPATTGRGSSRMGHRLRLLQGRLLPRHHQIPAGRLRQPLRLLPGLQRPGQRPVHRLRFGRLVLADLYRWWQRRLVRRQSHRRSKRQR